MAISCKQKEDEERALYIRYGIECKIFDNDDADFVKTIRRPREIKRTSAWKTTRKRLLKDKCEQCGGSDVLCFVYLWRVPGLKEFKTDLTLLIVRAKEAGYFPDSFTRDCCPECSSVSLRSRREIKPKFVCVNNKHEFEKPSQKLSILARGKTHKSKLESWAFISKRFGESIRTLYARLYSHLTDKYIAGAGTVTWCQKCYRNYTYRSIPNHWALKAVRSGTHGLRLLESLEIQAHEISWTMGLRKDVSAAFHARIFKDAICSQCDRDMFINVASIGCMAGGAQLVCQCGARARVITITKDMTLRDLSAQLPSINCGDKESESKENLIHSAHESMKKKKVKVARNKPCPCGSGKKFKKCYLKDIH
jgi:hypothetical protein